jgi:hypothetical protein
MTGAYGVNRGGFWFRIAWSPECHVLYWSSEMQDPFSSGRNGRSMAAQADVPSAAKLVRFFI